MDTIPTEEDWQDYDSDQILSLDVNYAHDKFIGKTNEQMLPLYKDQVLARAEDLHWMPIKPFQYYVFGFRDYVIKQEFGFYESSDAASSFLELILIKLKEQPEQIKPILEELMSDIEYIASNQKLFDADVDIYGDFLVLFNQIKELAYGA